MSVLRIDDINDLATMLGIPLGVLRKYIIYSESYYKKFRIKKRSGHGYRIICAPSKQLKGIQRWIMAFILSRINLPPTCTAFRSGYSILNNALPHKGKEFVFNIDIKNFFPTITTSRVIGLFMSIGYSANVAWGLGKLTTYQERLPQGAPSSPYIANLICLRMDSRLSGLCAKKKWSYTRYCDDITISGNGNISQSSVNFISSIIKDEGFDINQRKKHIARNNSRQQVTGLVVNEMPNIPKHKRKNWRAIFHQAKLNPDRFINRIPELQGYVAFLQMVKPTNKHIVRYKKIIENLKSRMVHD